ncbi:hypothetical protein Nepgr_016955 [Nepenthes gracilis]|uniref:Uncharacterized protein n=1 Tax=Nepenthes gracilis TaxID=150966 RepID=A0AAD3SQM3_NEPGR|nr:hypothetical protein Nepgr_016955 [Nepenthes gracilis]
MEPMTGGNGQVEGMKIALQQLIESRKAKEISGENSAAVNDDDDHQLLVKLLSQLESVKVDGMVQQPESLAKLEELPSCAVSDVETKSKTADEIAGDTVETGAEKVAKELKEVKRQNKITHLLLSALIILTVSWQLSEVSLILKLKERLSNPFKSLGSMLTEMLKGPPANCKIQQEQNQNEAPLLSSLKFPELPKDLELPPLDLPGLIYKGENE